MPFVGTLPRMGKEQLSPLADRLRLALAGPPKKTAAALARACEVKPPSVSDWLSGRTKRLEGANLLRAAAFLNVSQEWLATGRGPMRPRLNDSSSERSANPSDTSQPASQSARIDLDSLHEALTLLVNDEQQGGEYSFRGMAVRLRDLYERVHADGGKLTPEHYAEFEAEVLRRQGVKGGGANDVARRREQQDGRKGR